MNPAADPRSHIQALEARIAELEAAAAENARHRRLFEALMRFVPEGITIAEGHDVRITHVSDFGQQITGRRRSDLQGISAPDHVRNYGILRADGTAPEADELPLTRACRTGETITDEEWLLTRPDGSDITILCNAAPVLDDSGSLTGGLIVWRDITARKRAETALLETEERLRAVLKAANMVVWDWNVATGETTHFGDLESLLGPEHANSATVLSLVHPDDRDHLDRLHKSHIESGEPYIAEFRLLLPDGSVRWLRDRGSRQHDAATGETHMVGIAADITAMKQAELQLAQHQRFTADLIAAVPAITYIYDLDSRCNLFISDQCQEVLGFSPADFRAMGPNMLPNLLHPDDVSGVGNLFEGMLREPGKVFDFEYRMRHKDGHYVWIYSRDRLIDQSRILGVALDVTRRRRTDEALRAANSELTHFAYTVSHDLREPLRMIQSYSQLIGRRHADSMGPEVRQLFDYISDGARRMDRTIDGLLQFGRATHGDLSATPTDSAVALREVLGDLSSRIQETGARLAFSTDLPTVQCLPGGLALVFQNLIANAINYARPGIAPHIEIGATASPKHCTFYVRDNGQGIPAEHHTRIFSMFTRLHGDETPGTGIGLATVRRILERSGGRIWVESTPGAGSTFWFTLPPATR